MADYGVTDEGFVVKPLETIEEEIQDSFESTFGSDISISDGSPEANMIDVFAPMIEDLWDKFEQAYNAFAPSQTYGNSLDNLVALNNITRNEAQYSSVTLTFDGTAGTTIPSGTQVASDSSLTVDTYYFETTEELVLVGDTSSDTVNALCTETGAILLSPSTITVLSTTIVGVTSVTNEDSTVEGSDEETDAELRARRAIQVATEAVSTTDAIYAGIVDIDSINSALVLENNTDEDATVEGVVLDPHSIKVITYGADDSTERAEIAQAIYDRKDPGIPTTGSESEDVTDTQGFSHTMYWDTPESIEIYIIINTEATSDFPETGADDIRSAIVDYMTATDTGVGLGDNVRYAKLFTPINTVSDHYVQSMYIGTSASPTTMTDIDINGDEIATFFETLYDTTNYYIQVNVTYES